MASYNSALQCRNNDFRKYSIKYEEKGGSCKVEEESVSLPTVPLRKILKIGCQAAS